MVLFQPRRAQPPLAETARALEHGLGDRGSCRGRDAASPRTDPHMQHFYILFDRWQELYHPHGELS